MIPPFSDVEERRARDLASMLIAHAQVHLAAARAELEDAYVDAEVVIERLEHARAQALEWAERLRVACALRERADG